MKKCHFCGEEIQDQAKKCRFCGEWLESKESHITSKDQKRMQTSEHIKSLLKKLYRFSKKNRMGRGEYLIKLFIPLITLALLMQFINYLLGYSIFSDTTTEPSIIIQIIFFPIGLYILFIFLDRTIKRLHDINLPGRCILVPILNSLLVLGLVPGTNGLNKYGPSSEGPSGPIKGKNKIIELIVDKKELGTTTEFKGNKIHYPIDTKIGQKIIIKGKGYEGYAGGENGDLIYVVVEIQ